MNKKTKILIVKIVAVVVWLVALLSPTIFSMTEKVDMKDFNQVTDINQNSTTYYFEVEFSEVVVEGEITMGFYDVSGNLLFTGTATFENNKSEVVRIAIQSDEFVKQYDELADYNFYSATVTTKTADLVKTVMYPVAIALAVALVFVIRINYKEYEVDGKLVQIYAGVVNHTVYVDNIQAYSEKYLLTNKKTMICVPLSDVHEMEIVFRANNKIEATTRNRPVVENGEVVEAAEVSVDANQVVAQDTVEQGEAQETVKPSTAAAFDEEPKAEIATEAVRSIEEEAAFEENAETQKDDETNKNN